MADPKGFAAMPLMATSGWDFTSQNLVKANGDTNRLISESGRRGEERPTDNVGPKAIDSFTEHRSRKVVTGLPRSQTFTRKLSEQRKYLEPVATTTSERRAASIDKILAERSHELGTTDTAVSGYSSSSLDELGSNSSPNLLSERGNYHLSTKSLDPASLDSTSRYDDNPRTDEFSLLETVSSMTASQYDAMIAAELERKWILNLSMHYRDRSRREKFFVTYRKTDQLWRRVTISLDYRDPPPDSLEKELAKMKYQREKSAKIYEAIRESLPEISFYDTVTNLKLQTTDGRLHVHVVEDSNEIINYPLVDQIRDSSCKRVREKEIRFDCHMSGFVYKVRVHGQTLIKKEIPGPDTIDEFLYEVNALSSLRFSRHVVQLHGVVVDDYDEHVKGLLISYAEQGALIDIIYDHCKEQNFGISWKQRERWARQIVQGLADIHESGFVQGDFTLSNIVVNAAGDAKIIDINRRGCPVGWEPPESKTFVAVHHRINMYIGVKSDLYQLGMVLWALAMLEDEPELHPRPLILRPDVPIPRWYRDLTETCLSTDPRMRLNASILIQVFPPDPERYTGSLSPVDDAHNLDEDRAHEARTRQPDIIRTVVPSGGWPYSSKTYVDPSPDLYEPYYPMRGRSPPSPLPRHPDGFESPTRSYSSTSWAANKSVRPSYSDTADDDASTRYEEIFGTGLRLETPSSSGNIDTADVSSRQMGLLSRSLGLGDGLQMLSTPKLPGNDFATLGQKSDSEQHASWPENGNKEFARIYPRATGGLSHDALRRQPLHASAIQTTEGELDGGVSLQPENGLNSLHISQLGSQYPAPESDPEEDANGERPNGDKMRANETCNIKVSPSGVKECATDHLKLDSQAIRRRRPPFSRQRSLPISLTGMGATLQLDNDSKIKDTDDVEDDSSALARPATVQAAHNYDRITGMRKRMSITGFPPSSPAFNV
ncbi:hypothetical protein E4U41_006208 [Claviceps citrina]|nr:hypothetical protein E4U41_006208 [Claviceps citrina]